MYKVIETFTDLQDSNHRYHAGDIFPRNNLGVSEERIKELATDRNRQGKPLIKEVKVEKPKTDEIKETEAPKRSSRKRTKDAGADS